MCVCVCVCVCVSRDVIVDEVRQMKYSGCTESIFMVDETSNKWQQALSVIAKRVR